MLLFPQKTKALLAAVLLLAAGCNTIDAPAEITNDSFLQKMRPADNAVTFDIFWVRLPHTADGGDGGLWEEVYEDRLPADLRRRLADNGLRAGVIDASPPDRVLRLLNPAPAGEDTSAGMTGLRETGVSRRTRQVRPGQELELNASDVLPGAELTISVSGNREERVYQKAQSVYVLEMAPAEGDRTWVSLLPTVQHGDPRMTYALDETGVIGRNSMKRRVDAFPDLAIAAELAPGEMLVVTNLPDSASKLGGLLHTPATDTGCQRKMILVRVAAAAAESGHAFLSDGE